MAPMKMKNAVGMKSMAKAKPMKSMAKSMKVVANPMKAMAKSMKVVKAMAMSKAPAMKAKASGMKAKVMAMAKTDKTNTKVKAMAKTPKATGKKTLAMPIISKKPTGEQWKVEVETWKSETNCIRDKKTFGSKEEALRYVDKNYNHGGERLLSNGLDKIVKHFNRYWVGTDLLHQPQMFDSLMDELRKDMIAFEIHGDIPGYGDCCVRTAWIQKVK